jgi:septal ring factor EnvC (AmiA/AmiB activator)
MRNAKWQKKTTSFVSTGIFSSFLLKISIFSAKYMNKRDNLRLVLIEQQKKTKELEDFKNNHESTFAALQQKLKQSETEKQNLRAQLNVADRKAADAADR